MLLLIWYAHNMFRYEGTCSSVLVIAFQTLYFYCGILNLDNMSPLATQLGPALSPLHYLLCTFGSPQTIEYLKLILM